MVERLRGRAGQAQRDRRLKRTNYLCEHCLAKGVTTPAERVNHKRPLAHGGTDDDGNTENLCIECDRLVTADQFEKKARHRIEIGEDGWPLA